MAVVGGALLGLISTGGGAYLFGATLWASVLTGASLGYAFSTQDVPGASSPTYSFGEISNTKTQLLPVPIVYGHCRVAGNVFYCRYYDDQKQKADQYIGISEGPIQGITEVMAGDQLIEDLSECSLDIYLNSDSSTSDKRDPKGDVQRPYPNDFAFIATTLKAQEKYRGNEPITSIVDGRIVWTPTGLRWTSNPAWIIRDFITDKRYGFGIPPSAIDEISFAEAAAYCDGVPLGSVGPRFTLNGVIDTKKKGVDHLKEMLSCFRGFIIAREKVALRVEAPVLNYDRKIGFDEIVTGTFSWWESGNDEILNRVIIQWTDPENAWEQTTTIFENTADIIKRGIIDKTFSLNWITSADQASRMGAFLLDCSNAVTNFCSFGLTLSCADVELGDVIALTNDLPGWEDKWMRVISIDDGENDSITVTCSEYVAEVYNDRAMDFPIHVDTNLPNPWTCPDVIGLTGAERVTVDTDGTVLSDIDLFWTDPDVLLRSVEVLVLEAGSVTWKSCGTVLPGVGNYVVRGLASNQVVSVLVRPVNTAGIKAVGKTVTLTLHGKAYPPAEPTELTAVGGFQVVEISWRNPGDADLKHIEVWESKDDVQANAYKAADVDGTSLTRSNLSNLTTFWYWIRAVDTSGNVSGWVGPVSATTETIKAPDIPEGLIDPPMLSDVLREPIERIPDIEVDIEGINVEVGNIRDITIPSIDAEIKEIQDITIPSIDAEIKEIQDITIPSIDAEIKEIQDITIPEVNINIRDSIQRLSERVSELDEGYVEQLRQAGSGAIRTLLQLRGINKKLTDAGIVVDPSTGQVRIWAVDQLRNEYNIRLSEAEITVDALASSIKSKASLAEVDARIAEAVFGDVGELLVSGLQARIVTVEENLNAVEGTLTEKASAVDVNEIGGRVTVAESRLDGLDAEIALTASTEEVGQLNSRVTSAETKIDGFQGAVTTQVVALSKDGRDLSGLTAEGVIRNVLNANNDRKAKNIQLALAKESLKAYTDQGLAAEAQQRLDLAAIVGVNHAELIEEKTVRSSQNEAVVQSIEILSAKTDQNDARITSETTARTDGDSALSGRLDTVQAKVEGNTAAIQTEANARADETSALGSRLDTVQAKTNANEAAIQTEAQTRANETGANAQAISTVAANLGKEETERKAAIQQVSTAIVDGDSALSSRIDTVQAKANNNTAAIQTEAQTRANETGALAEEINTLQTRTGNNESAIQEEREVRSNETSAIGSTVSTLVSESDANLGESVIKGILQLAKARALIKTERATNTSEREALASLITTLQAELGNTQAVIQEEQTVRATETGANASAIRTVAAKLDDEVGNRQAAVKSEADARVDALGAIGERIDAVQTKANNNESAIQTEAQARSNETGAMGSLMTTVVASSDKSLAEATVKDLLNRHSDKKRSNRQLAVIQQNLKAEIEEGISSEAAKRETLASQIDGSLAAVDTQLNTLATQDKAMAEAISTVQATANGNTSSVKTVAEAVADVDGLLKAQYVIKVDANGKVAGIGLVANGEVSEFAINADRLLLIDPNGGSDIPPFVVGVDPETGKAALYLNGDLFAAGTIKGEHINASSTISLAGGAILLDGINGVVRISDPNDLVHGDYLTITNGYLRQYMWIDGAYRLRRALTTRETGVAENNTWCMLKERYNNAPDIHISPYNLSCYNPAYQAQPQNLVLKVKEVANIAPGQWRFLPEATLAVGTESGSTPPPVVPEGLPGSYVQSNDYGYEERKTTESYSHSTTLPPNLQSLTVRVKLEPKSFWCNKDSDGGGTYYKGGYGTAFLQIRQVGGSWSDVASSSVRIRTEGYAQTVALSWSGFLVGVNYEMRVLAKSYYYPDCYPSDDIHVWWNGMQYHIFNRADRYPFEILSAEVTFRAGTVLATGTVNYIAVGE